MAIFIIVWTLWFLSQVVINRLLRQGNSDMPDQDLGSLRLIWVAAGIGNTLGILSKIFLSVPMSGNFFVPYCGLGVILIGIAIHLISVLSLGKFFTVTVTIRHDHTIKTDGIYGFVRHPSYLGTILSFVGFGISLNNWISFIIVPLMVIIAMFRRMSIEERLLMKHFGEQYGEYMKNTKRLVPLVY
jgi:protein-S-isoprenylcysteine O-methyltransferase Ste14